MFTLILALITLIAMAFQLGEEIDLAQSERLQRFATVSDVKAHNFRLW